MIGDGFCNDETNNADCSYDGGDCCGSCIVTDLCSQCECIGGADVTNVLISNGFCNDETNSADCNYDGGDCCVNINTDVCSNCTCYHQENCLLGFTPSVVSDGLCHDETNNAACNYDGGDCCGYSTQQYTTTTTTVPSISEITETTQTAQTETTETETTETHPTEAQTIETQTTEPPTLQPPITHPCSDCKCYHQENCAAGYTPSVVGDGFCNDETNNADCNHDGGDCCVNVNKDVCSDCDCISGGVITSPGFPENYDNYLNLTWLIEVPPGQRIQIRFLSFDVENCDSACM